MTPPTRLFRQEVVEFEQHRREWGGIVLLQPISTKIFSWSLTVAIAVIISFLSLAQYARKESVSGYLTPSGGTAKIFTPQVGTIRDVHVKEGEVVQSGQILLTIDTAQVSLDGQDVNTSIATNLEQQKKLLGAQVVAEEQRFASEQDRLNASIRALEVQLSRLNMALRIQGERIELAKDFVASAAQLSAKGYTAEVEVKRRQQIVLEQEQTLNALYQDQSARQSQLTEARFTLVQLPTLMAQKVQSLRNDLSAVEQRIAEINSRRAYVIRSPVAGIVSTLQATTGQATDPRRLQLEIVPANSILQAELFIPTRAVGLVQAGQEVRLLYEAFPYQKFGTYTGKIVKLSQTVLRGTDAAGPVDLKEPSYKATVALARTTVDAGTKTVPLQADMLLSATIILEKRSILAWLFDPLFTVGNIVDLEAMQKTFSGWTSSIIDLFYRTERYLREAAGSAGPQRETGRPELRRI